MTSDNGQPAAHHTIMERSVCLLLSCGYLGNYRRVELRSVDVTKDGVKLDGEKDEMGATKRLFANKDLTACSAAIESVKQRLRALSVNGARRLFGDGAYLLPLLAVTEAEKVLAEGKALVEQKTDELVKRREEILAERKLKLGPLFVESEYPSADQMRHAFRISWSYASFGAPERLMEVDAAAYAQASESWNERLSNSYDDVVLGLRESAALVMRELAERLKPGADGKAKALRPTALRDLQDLLQKLPVLNSIGEDDALAGIVARVGGLAQGLDVETLKNAPAIRGMLVKAAEEAAEQLGALVTTGRAFALTGDL